MPPAWKVRLGHLVFGSSVRPFVRPAYKQSVLFYNPYIRNYWWGLYFSVSMLLQFYAKQDMCLRNTDAPGGNKVKIWQNL